MFVFYFVLIVALIFDHQEKRFYAKDEDNVRQVVLQRDTGQLRHSTQVMLRATWQKSQHLQGSAKRWGLGCVNSPEGAKRRDSRNLGTISVHIPTLSKPHVKPKVTE